MGVHGGCDLRIKVGWWVGVRVDVNEELKFLGKFKKKRKKFFFFLGGGGGRVGGGGGVRVDVNKELKFCEN